MLVLRHRFFNLSNIAAPLLGSVAIHGLLIIMCMLLYKFDINLFNLFSGQKTEIAEIEITKEIRDVILSQSLLDSGTYNGSMSLHNTTPEEKTEKQSNRAAQITARMSGLAERIARIDISDMKIKLGKGGLSSDLNAKIGSLGTQSMAGTGGTLSSRIKSLGSGNVGKTMKWNLLGAATTNISSQDQERLAHIMRDLQDDFRDCYEKALLKDESMAVTARIEAEITAAGRFAQPQYNLTGSSTTESEAVLSGCMTGLLSKVQVGKSLAGVIMKNQIIFR